MIDGLLGNERIGAVITGNVLHAPVTVDAEVLQGLRRAWLDERLSEGQARSVLASFKHTVILRHPVTSLVERMWSLRHNVSAYDASYVALAEELNLPLITRDRRLSRSSGHSVRIEYID